MPTPPPNAVSSTPDAIGRAACSGIRALALTLCAAVLTAALPAERTASLTSTERASGTLAAAAPMGQNPSGQNPSGQNPSGLGTADQPGASTGKLEGRGRSLQVVEADETDREMRMTPAVRVVQKTADSVVSIYIGHGLTTRGGQPEGQGSGVILDEGGFIITNWHVIAAAQADSSYKIVIKLKDGRSRAARILSSSPEHDLALLQMQLEGGETVQPVEIGRSDGLMIGEDVIAIGNPQGHANTVTRGVLSAIGRTIQVRDPVNYRAARTYSNLLQTDAAINQGNSGGALFDITGKLIGINNAMAMGAENIGFAIPVDTVREVFENELTASDRFLTTADAPWLGLSLVQEDGQLVIDSVVEGGPASLAGLQVGDVVLEAGGAELQSRIDFDRRAFTAQPGSAFPMRVRRDGANLSAAPTPIQRFVAPVLLMTGMALEEVSSNRDRALAERVTRKFYEGSQRYRLPIFSAVMRVLNVSADSPAANLGVEPGDLLMAVYVKDRYGREREVPLDSASNFTQFLRQQQGQTIRIVILRGDEDLTGPLEVLRIENQR